MRRTQRLEFVGVKMPADQRRRLFALAKERSVSASELVRQALDAFSARAA